MLYKRFKVLKQVGSVQYRIAVYENTLCIESRVMSKTISKHTCHLRHRLLFPSMCITYLLRGINEAVSQPIIRSFVVKGNFQEAFRFARDPKGITSDSSTTIPHNFYTEFHNRGTHRSFGAGTS